MEFETFITKVRDAGCGSKEITIPANLVKFLGLESGDIVKAMIKKKGDENNEL